MSIGLVFLCLRIAFHLPFHPPAVFAVQYGEEAIKEGMGAGGGGGGGGVDLFDILSGATGGRRGQRERKSEDVVHKLSVTLEELYNGVTK